LFATTTICVSIIDDVGLGGVSCGVGIDIIAYITKKSIIIIVTNNTFIDTVAICVNPA
jgi:hypothetical protein